VRCGREELGYSNTVECSRSRKECGGVPGAASSLKHRGWELYLMQWENRLRPRGDEGMKQSGGNNQHFC
jgi:hypothetical protein